MDRKEKTKKDDNSKETGFGFLFGDCQAMFEKMSMCCGDKSNAIDCCSMMERVMEDKSGKSKGGDKREKE